MPFPDSRGAIAQLCEAQEEDRSAGFQRIWIWIWPVASSEESVYL